MLLLRVNVFLIVLFLLLCVTLAGLTAGSARFCYVLYCDDELLLMDVNTRFNGKRNETEKGKCL